MPELSDATTLVRTPTAIGTDVGDKVVLLDERHGYLELNPVGAAIWERLVQPTALATLVSNLGESFGVDSATVRRDVMPFLETLVARGLVIAT